MNGVSGNWEHDLCMCLMNTCMAALSHLAGPHVMLVATKAAVSYSWSCNTRPGSAFSAVSARNGFYCLSWSTGSFESPWHRAAGPCLALGGSEQLSLHWLVALLSFPATGYQQCLLCWELKGDCPHLTQPCKAREAVSGAAGTPEPVESSDHASFPCISNSGLGDSHWGPLGTALQFKVAEKLLKILYKCGHCLRADTPGSHQPALRPLSPVPVS